jgi:hypothetical protein
LIRRISQSRRTLLGGALLAISGANIERAAARKRKKCSFCKKRKKGRCKSNPARNGVICATDYVCRNGGCVGFDVTCAADATSCTTDVPCGPNVVDCSCYQRVTNGGAVCGATGGFTACSQPGCQDDDDCATGQACIVSNGLGCNSRPSGSVCVNLCEGPV